MPLTNNGRNYLADAWIGGTSFTKLNNANAYLCVGDGTTPFSVSQTDLYGTNKLRKAMDSGYPTRSGNADTFRGTFGPLEANFAWNTWGIANAASGNYLLTAKVESLGTKTAGATWELTVTNVWQ